MHCKYPKGKGRPAKEATVQNTRLPNRFAKAEIKGKQRAPSDRRNFENNFAKPAAYKGNKGSGTEIAAIMRGWL